MKLTRELYFKKQKELSKTAARAEAESIRRIKEVTRNLVLPLVRQYAEQGMISFPKEELARQIDHIIREEGSKPVMAARKLHEDMEASLAEKLGIIIKKRVEPDENAKQRRLNAKRKPIGTIIKLPGRGWGYGASSKGLASYYRDPQTGKIVWTDLPLEYQFAKRADLSTLVWKSVEEQEQMVFDVIQGGRALGRNVKDIAKDMETFINYPNGGEKVVGRWMGMFPNTEAGRREAWQREYLASHGGLQPGSDAAKALLKQQDAKDWVQQQMDLKTKRGTPKLPAAVKQYATRLGKAGLDYRTIRIARTETTAMLADEQTAIAENSDISSGLMDFVMDRGRDHWNCSCERYAEQNPWRVDDPDRPEIPVHPSCMCQWVPRLKTDDEIIKAFREEMKEELDAIQGTPEQADMLEQFSKVEGVNVYQLTEQKITELESSLRKSDDIFSKLSLDEAKTLIEEIRTKYPDKGRFANDVEKELKRLERSEQFTQIIRDNGIDIPKSNIKIDIEEDMFNELMANPDKWLEYVKQSEALDNGWGYAEKDNRFGQALIFVNGGEYRPIDKGEMIYNFKGYTNVGDVAIALRSRRFAAENVSKVDVPELLRVERRSNEWVKQLKEGYSIPLTGITSFSANEKHISHYTGLLEKGEFKARGDAIINYHLELNDTARNKAMFLQLDDCHLGNTDWTKCSEVALQGLSCKVVSISYNKQKGLWDIFITLK